MKMSIPSRALLLVLLSGSGVPAAMLAQADTGPQAMPRLLRRDGRFAFLVDGKPYLMLGAQINNSSSWASTLPQVWPALDAMHVNTMEAPVYWEQMEPREGTFDFSGVDLLVRGAREHHLRLVLLWFGTWKNGQNHYVPEWIKTNPTRFPREVSAEGKLLDVQSPHSSENLHADQHAFAALMHHVRELDGTQHTVVMIQVENETGAIGTVRDHTAMADQEFAAPVPAALHAGTGSWIKIYGSAAEERFAAYATARYVNAVAEAGKQEYPLPMYCNAWLTYPVHALANRDHPSAGQEYPSGGPQQGNLEIWKVAAPAIDLLGPDFYADDRQLFRDVVAAYARPDNALFIPETHLAHDFGPNLFYALGHGAIGFSPFGIDFSGWTTLEGTTVPSYLADNFSLLTPLEGEIAQWNLEGKLSTVVETPGQAQKRIHFAAMGNLPAVDAVVSFGFPQHDGEAPPGTSDASGRALMARLAPLEFVVTGFDASVRFESAESPSEPGTMAQPKQQVEILTAEQGTYVDGTWQKTRIWNGDQTDRGLDFPAANKDVIRILLHAFPLNAQ